MVDVHCHLDDPKLERYIPEDDISVITVGTNVKSSEKAVDLADKFTNVWACVGIHPENSYEPGVMSHETIQMIQKLTKNKKVVGIGEVGLDYRPETKPEEKEKQRQLFMQMLDLVKETNLPVQIHNRGADNEMFDILNKYRGLKILMHCFTRNLEFMQKMASLGAYFSFGGMVTYENNSRMRNVVKFVPENKLLLETDSPYSVPVGGTGDINTPANVKIVAEKIAKLRGMTIQDVDKLTSANAGRLFKLT